MSAALGEKSFHLRAVGDAALTDIFKAFLDIFQLFVRKNINAGKVTFYLFCSADKALTRLLRPSLCPLHEFVEPINHELLLS